MTDGSIRKNVTDARGVISGSAAGAVQTARQARGRGAAYLLLTYFSRRICGTGRPKPFSVSKQASTMFGLPHR